MISGRLTLGMGHVGEDLTWRDAAAPPGKMSYYNVREEQGKRRNRLGIAHVDHLHSSFSPTLALPMRSTRG